MKELSSRESIEKRVSDLCYIADKQYTPKFTAFLNEQEQFFAKSFLDSQGAVYAFWGGAECCTRKMLCVLPFEMEAEFPVYPVTITFRKAYTLTHRDFLGSFMALQIGREQIGDILMGEGYAIVFCTLTAHDMITADISKIGRVGVDISDGINAPLPEAVFEETAAVVASLRSDCVVSALSGLSREKSADFIRAGNLTLNYESCGSVSKLLAQGDIISLRGYGKFVLCDEGVQTKKGKLRINLKKYI